VFSQDSKHVPPKYFIIIMIIIIIIIIIYLFISTANGVLPGASGTTITHITQNNTPRSNRTQHTKQQRR
jgi:hypothetical protein